MSGGPAKTIVRTYTGDQTRAAQWFQQDAANLAKTHYFPTSQTYAPGQHGCGAFLLALLLCVILVGVIVFIYLLIVPPDGTLTVTYEYRPPQASNDKVCPRCAESVKAAAAVCRFCGHEFDVTGYTPPPPTVRSAPPSSPIDPFALARQGGDVLQNRLDQMGTDGLRRTAVECNFGQGPALQHWKRADVIKLIVSEAKAQIDSEPPPVFGS